MKQQPKKYDITQCALYKCSNKRRLEKILRLDDGELKKINDMIRYHSFHIDKKDSKEKRQIMAPDYELKKTQRRILCLLQRVIRPEWLISGEKGKSYIDNGKAHLLSRYAFTMDIKKFYENCSREAVYQFFIKKLHTSKDIAKILSDIVTFNSKIPTGCPTSQIIAFYAYYDMFEEINALAQSYDCVFTLYVDDMTFSSMNPIPQRLEREVDVILRKYGHKLKDSKVRYYRPEDYKTITGTVVTPKHDLVTPNGLQKEIYTSFQQVKPRLDGTPMSTDETKLMQRLKGQIQASRNIEEGKFPEMIRLIKKIDSFNGVG